MPIYEYRCEHCQHEMEVIQKISDEPLKDCPECKQATLRKLVSAAAFKLKGDGWYETDFKDKKPKKKDIPDKEGDGKDNKGKKDSSSSKDKGSDKSGGSEKSDNKSESKTEKPKKKPSATKSSK